MAQGLITQALDRKRADTGESNRYTTLGFYVFRKIVRDTDIFKSSEGHFHFSHMDMGTQNILVDDDSRFVAVIDWELAHTAPWEVNHYPMPISLVMPDMRIINFLNDPNHVAHQNTARQVGARILYRQKFMEAEQALEKGGRSLHHSIAETLDGKASRIYGLIERFGVYHGMEEQLTCELVHLGFGLKGPEAEQFLQGVEEQVEREGQVEREEQVERKTATAKKREGKGSWLSSLSGIG